MVFFWEFSLTRNCCLVQRNLRSERKENVFGKKRSKKVGNITLRLESIDSQTRAENELKTAEQSIERIQALVDRVGDRDEVIGTVIDVAERIISIVDEVAKVIGHFISAGALYTYIPLFRSILYSMYRGTQSRHCTRRVSACRIVSTPMC